MPTIGPFGEYSKQVGTTVDLVVDIQATLQKINLLKQRMQHCNLPEEERQKLMTETAEQIARLTGNHELRLPALSADRPASFGKSRLTRISTDTPASNNYHIFCNGKALEGCIFADELGNIAVCYKLENKHFVRNDDMSIKTVVHHGKITISKLEERKSKCDKCEEAVSTFDKYGQNIPDDYVCPICQRRGSNIKN